MPEQRVKTVNFDDCKKDPKLIAYHSNVSSITEKLFQFYNLHTWAYCGPVFAEIFGMMCRFLPSRPKRYRNSLRDLWASWTDLHRNCTECSKNCALYHLPGKWNCDIWIRCEMPACWIKVFSQILPKIGCHANVPKESKKENSCKYLSFGEKIVKIGPVGPEIALLIVKNKEEEITEGKIYSPVGNLAELATK